MLDDDLLYPVGDVTHVSRPSDLSLDIGRSGRRFSLYSGT